MNQLLLALSKLDAPRERIDVNHTIKRTQTGSGTGRIGIAVLDIYEDGAEVFVKCQCIIWWERGSFLTLMT